MSISLMLLESIKYPVPSGVIINPNIMNIGNISLTGGSHDGSLCCLKGVSINHKSNGMKWIRRISKTMRRSLMAVALPTDFFGFLFLYGAVTVTDGGGS